MNDAELRELAQGHEPNTPRTHDASGRKIDPPEPVQCCRCLQTYPCTTKRLVNEALAAGPRALREAADAIQALHPGEEKNSVIFLRERADS